jgi:hypothetical protein
MNSRKQKVVMAGVMLAIAASAFGARAADQSAYFEQQREISDGYVAPQFEGTRPATAVSQSESPQFEAFERQWSLGDWKDYAPSEHPASAPSNADSRQSGPDVFASESAGGSE